MTHRDRSEDSGLVWLNRGSKIEERSFPQACFKIHGSLEVKNQGQCMIMDECNR